MPEVTLRDEQAEERQRQAEEVAAERQRVVDEAKNGTKADQARGNVSQQLFELVSGSETTGSARMIALRFTELIDAQRTGDKLLERAAAMELSRASALYAVALDLRAPAG